MDHGADLNSRTLGPRRSKNGGTALWWAYEFHDESHEVIDYLKNLGAKHLAPGAKDESKPGSAKERVGADVKDEL